MLWSANRLAAACPTSVTESSYTLARRRITACDTLCATVTDCNRQVIGQKSLLNGGSIHIPESDLESTAGFSRSPNPHLNIIFKTDGVRHGMHILGKGSLSIPFILNGEQVILLSHEEART